MKKFTIIVAIDKNNGMGLNNDLPWHLPKDLAYFKETTLNQTVIMGRNTWEGLPDRFKPLPKRTNIVVTTNTGYSLPEGVLLASSLEEALQKTAPETTPFVIGGAKLFEKAINSSYCQQLYVTHIDSIFDCDTFFPEIPNRFKKTVSGDLINDNGISMRFSQYRN